MAEDGAFRFEDCLLKHHVRTKVWLPFCKRRLNELRSGLPAARNRRLKYFTFCAVGAIDVLMLDVSNVIKRSDTGRFDTVFFFDRTRDLVEETQKRIPGSIGFPGDLIELVLAPDPAEDELSDSLDAPTERIDSRETRRSQIAAATRRDFVSSFPFDVINLDLEQFFFRPNDPIPGKLVNAMRKLFEWQKRPFKAARNKEYSLDAFTLLFTTQVGPKNLGEDYLAMLRASLAENIAEYPELSPLLEERTGTAHIATLEKKSFATFFKLAAPKMIAKILNERDWYIDDQNGVRIHAFDRDSQKGPYTMLHLAMDVRRKVPPIERRPPGNEPAVALAAYKKNVMTLFRESEIVVTESSIDKAALQQDLNRIKDRRRMYYPDEV